MSSPPVLLLFGYGTTIGASITEAFKAKGYNLVLVSRLTNEETSTGTELHIKADLSDTSTVSNAFEKVKEKFGTPPSVVVYNGISLFTQHIFDFSTHLSRIFKPLSRSSQAS